MKKKDKLNATLEVRCIIYRIIETFISILQSKGIIYWWIGGW